MKYVIYGAGNNAKKYIDDMQQYIDIDCIIDNDRAKWGLNIDGIKIMPSSDFFASINDLGGRKEKL